MRIENSCHSDNKRYIIERIDKHFKRRRKKVTAGTILRLEILPLSFSSLKSLHARKPTNPSEHGLLVYFFSLSSALVSLYLFSRRRSRGKGRHRVPPTGSSPVKSSLRLRANFHGVEVGVLLPFFFRSISSSPTTSRREPFPSKMTISLARTFVASMKEKQIERMFGDFSRSYARVNLDRERERFLFRSGNERTGREID